MHLRLKCLSVVLAGAMIGGELLTGIGSFSLNGSFCKDKQPGENHRAESIEIKNVVFKAEKQLKKRIATAGFEKYNPERHNKRKY